MSEDVKRCNKMPNLETSFGNMTNLQIKSYKFKVLIGKKSVSHSGTCPLSKKKGSPKSKGGITGVILDSNFFRVLFVIGS